MEDWTIYRLAGDDLKKMEKEVKEYESFTSIYPQFHIF